MLELDYDDDPLAAISKSLKLDQFETTEKPSSMLKNAFSNRVKRLEQMLKDSSLSESTREDYLTEIKILTE